MNTDPESLAIDSDKAFAFFLTNLHAELVKEPKEEGTRKEVVVDEMLYVAGILAHYAQTSRHDTAWMPCPANLSEVFDNFFGLGPSAADPEILAIGGAQTLLMAGFFRDQMSHRKRYNLKWYDQMGRSFYSMASRHSKQRKEQDLFEQISLSFAEWTVTCRNLSRSLHEARKNRFLLRTN